MGNDKQCGLDSQKALLLQLVQGGGDLFGYHVQGRQGVFSSVIAQRYDHPEVIDDLPVWMVAHSQVHRESVDDWMALFNAIDRGEKHGSGKVLMRSEDGGFSWYWLRFNSFSNKGGDPVFATVSFENIGQEHEQIRLQTQDISALLQATQKTFPELLTLNLTKGTYRIIAYHSGTTLGSPQEGSIDEVIRIRLNGVVEEDRDSFAGAFSYEALKDAFIRQGRESVQLVYRRFGRDGNIYWFETTGMRQDNESDNDILLVVMSRSIDDQKAQEARLQEQLWLRAEEIRVTSSKMRRSICYYDVPTMTLTLTADYARKHNISQTISNYPASMTLEGKDYYPETATTIHRFYGGILSGKPTGSCELAFKHPEGVSWQRWEYAMVYDQKGQPQRAVIFVDDITAQRLQARENQRLKENEQILRLIAQHSDRVVCFYDVQKGVAQPWDVDTCKRCGMPRLCEIPVLALLENHEAQSEDTEALREMFRDIHSGTPNGSLKLRVTPPDKKGKWFDLRYTTIFDDNGVPASALISHMDITEQYEHELTYLRHTQSMQNSRNHLGIFEVDLTTNLVESMSGRLAATNVSAVGTDLTAFSHRLVNAKLLSSDIQEGLKFCSAEYLTAQYTAGSRQLEREWRIRFRDGSLGWARVSVDMMADPYNGHLKAFFSITDITEEKIAQLEIQNRSERDSMTGLLNRVTSEERIREEIANNDRAGILLLLDLDDLKGINDTFGHAEGDRAILGISDTLKLHFRETDIIGRIGGDEFMVYLPGAAANRSTIESSISALLRKLTVLSVGAGNQRRIHCSIGCAIQTPEDDSFEVLYKQADVALYQVKRSGKNNYAFYSPDMMQADYRFQTQRLMALQREKKFEVEELQYLLNAISCFYQLILSMNLSTNDYFLMDEIAAGVFSKLPPYGSMDDFVTLTARGVHPKDAPEFMEHLSRDSLLNAYARGETSVRRYFRFYDGKEYQWTEASIIFYTNEQGNVCDFTLVRWATERAFELDQLWLHKVLELAVVSSFEYICLIDTGSGEYSLFGSDANTHHVPRSGKFEDATRSIAENLIAPDARAVYYENANISNIITIMKESGEPYSYRYTVPAGDRIATFHWFESSHTHLLMTVQQR